jgi:hypothetical protein
LANRVGACFIASLIESPELFEGAIDAIAVGYEGPLDKGSGEPSETCLGANYSSVIDYSRLWRTPLL